MHRRYAKVLVLASAILLAAAGMSFAGGSSEKGGMNPTTLSVMITASWWPPVMDEIAKAALAATGVAVDVQKLPEGAQGHQVIMTKLASDSAPDILGWSGGDFLTQLNPEHNLAEISSLPVASIIKAQAKASLSFNGKLYGVPNAANGWGFEGIFYSKKLFSELNLTVPTTLDEMYAVCEKIKQAGKTAVWVSSKDTWSTQQMAEDYWPWIMKKHPDYLAKILANKLKLADIPEYVDSLGIMHEFVQKGYVNADWATATYDQGIKALIDGTAGMYAQGSWIFTALEANYPDQVNAIGYFPQPIDGNNLVAVSVPTAFFISRQSKNFKAAGAWLQYYGTKGQQTYYAHSKGLPMFEGVTADMWPAYRDIVNMFESGRWGYNQQEGMPIMFPDYEAICQAALSGNMTPLQAAQTVDQNFAQALRQLGTPGW
jgi:raffinose/stachyose/melibiose transport system substrate-binding protein